MKAAETVKANNFDTAVQQVPKEWGIDIPDTISAAEKGFYHVLVVERQHIPEQERYVTRPRIVKLRPEFWNNKKSPIDKTMATLGYRNRFVIHDPSKPEVAPKKAGRPSKAKTEENKETQSED
jgi:hypothetical protein